MMIQGNPTGELISHYNMSKDNIALLLFMKGINDVLRKDDIKIIINISYIHYEFLDILKKYKIKYDYVGLHWFSEMGNLYDFGSTHRNIID